MLIENLQPGDMIEAAIQITNDGSVPGIDQDALIAEKGQRGVIIQTGHLEDLPEKALFLVRFEGKEGLGPPVGCWEEELALPAEFMQ